MKTVLVVDDDADDREIIQTFLEMHHFQVVCAENGQEALGILSQRVHDISIILLDIMMPIMSGSELLDHIQANTDLSTIPVIIISAASDLAEKLRQRAKRLEKKPLDLDRLLRSVQTFALAQ